LEKGIKMESLYKISVEYAVLLRYYEDIFEIVQETKKKSVAISSQAKCADLVPPRTAILLPNLQVEGVAWPLQRIPHGR
jgi:hypothetical protein